MSGVISPTVPVSQGQVLPRIGFAQGGLGETIRGLAGRSEGTVTQRRAQKIMGPNMLSIKETIQTLGIPITNGNLAHYRTVPVSRTELEECSDSHRLVPCLLPISMLKLKARAPSTLFFSPNGNSWTIKEAFARKEIEPGWHLVPVDAFSTKAPQANVLFYTLLLYFLSRGIQLAQGTLVPCRDFASDGSKVGIGLFNGKLVVNTL